MAKEKSLIVIKKIIVSGGGHHGGSWKVALADFMTAMMAFFLVMWLLNQTEETKKAVSDYFSTPSIIEYNFQNFGAELTRDFQAFDGEAIEIRIGKLLGLSFVNHEETAPGARFVLLIDAEAFAAQALGHFLEHEVLLGVGGTHEKAKR